MELDKLQNEINRLKRMDCCIDFKIQVYDEFVRLSDVNKIIREFVKERNGRERI